MNIGGVRGGEEWKGGWRGEVVEVREGKLEDMERRCR